MGPVQKPSSVMWVWMCHGLPGNVRRAGHICPQAEQTMSTHGWR